MPLRSLATFARDNCPSAIFLGPHYKIKGYYTFILAVGYHPLYPHPVLSSYENVEWQHTGWVVVLLCYLEMNEICKISNIFSICQSITIVLWRITPFLKKKINRMTWNKSIPGGFLLTVGQSQQFFVDFTLTHDEICKQLHCLMA